MRVFSLKVIRFVPFSLLISKASNKLVDELGSKFSLDCCSTFQTFDQNASTFSSTRFTKFELT